MQNATLSGKKHLLRFTFYAVLLLGFTSCAGITKVKYIQHMASKQLKLPNNTVVTAPAGKHYMLYLVNCIDNTKRKNDFLFNSSKILDANGQNVNAPQVAYYTELVPKGGIETAIGQLVLELPGDPDKYLYNLNYASTSGESVLMVNQTTSSENGAHHFIPAIINLSEATSSPYIKDNYCAEKGSYHTP